MSVKQDQRRFREIVKGKIKDNFKKYNTHEEMIGKKKQEGQPTPLHDSTHSHALRGNEELASHLFFCDLCSFYGKTSSLPLAYPCVFSRLTLFGPFLAGFLHV